MKHLLGLSVRRFGTDRKSRLAAAVITALVVTAWLLYWGYMEYMGASMSGRVASAAFPADFAIVLPPGTDYAMNSYYAETLQTYQALEAETALGLQPVAAIYYSSPGAPLPDPAPGEIWLPDSLRGWGEIAAGSPFTLRYLQDMRYREVSGTVAGYYPSYDYYPAIVVDSYWLTEQGMRLEAEQVSLYQQAANFGRWPGHLPMGAKLVTARTTAERAREIVAVAFSSGGEGVGLLFLFLVLGVGTFNLLSFMDGRRELALLKSMGLRPGEMGGLFVIESLLTGLLGIGAGLITVSVLDGWTMLPIEVTWPLIGRMTFLCFLAFAAATAAPFILAKKGSVNELLFGRPIPLIRRTVTDIARRYPALEPLLAAGFQLVKLPSADGDFPGICFRRLGQTVKQGETVAWQGSAWGLKELEYLAPCDGEVVQADLSQGLLVIKPI